MGCSSSKLHPLVSETCDLLDKNVEKRKELQSSFHEDFAIEFCECNAPIVTFVESVSFYSRSTSCDSDETRSESALKIEQNDKSQTNSKPPDGFALSETLADMPIDDESDLKDWLREIEETICTNPNQSILHTLLYTNSPKVQGLAGMYVQDQRTKDMSPKERDLRRSVHAWNELNSFYKETTMGDESGITENDYRNNISTPCQQKELCFNDHTHVTTINSREQTEIGVEVKRN